MKITDYEGKEWELSEEIYKITDNDHPSHDFGYGKGNRVRKINYTSFDPKYSVVCRIDAEIAEFCGIKKSSLKLIE